MKNKDIFKYKILINKLESNFDIISYRKFRDLVYENMDHFMDHIDFKHELYNTMASSDVGYHYPLDFNKNKEKIILSWINLFRRSDKSKKYIKFFLERDVTCGIHLSYNRILHIDKIVIE